MQDNPKHGNVAVIYQSVLAGSAVIYASGFIVVYTFLERWGIRETGDQFLRVKYFHVGFLTLLFPILWMAPGFLLGNLLRLRRKAPSFNWKESSVWLTPCLSISLSTPLCLLPVFAYGSYLRSHGWEIAFLVFAALIGLVFASEPIRVPGGQTGLIYSRPDSQQRSTVRRTMRTCVAVMMLALSVYLNERLLVDLWPELWQVFWTSNTAPAAWLYLLFNFLIGFYVWRAGRRLREVANSEMAPGTVSAHGSNIRFLTGCRIAGFYFLGVLAFSYGWYPFIPAARGGGNLSEVPSATINVKISSPIPPDLTDLFDEKMMKSQFDLSAGGSVNAQTTPVAVIEVTSASVFVAWLKDKGGPACWAEGYLPRVYELSRGAVQSITYKGLVLPERENAPPPTVGGWKGVLRKILGPAHPSNYLCSPEAPKHDYGSRGP
jgi:hypothetical protein